MANEVNVTVGKSDVVVIKDVAVIVNSEVVAALKQATTTGVEGEVRVTITIKN